MRYPLLCFAVFVWSLTGPVAFAVETTAISSPSGSDPMVILDGDSSTVWSSEKTGEQEITVDLGYLWPLKSVEIEWGKNHPSEYELQLSTGEDSWRTVFRAKDFKRPEARGMFPFKFTVHKIEPPVKVSRLRIRCLKAGSKVEIVDLRLNGQYPFCYEPVPDDAVCLNKTADPEARVQDVLRRMTVREKIGMVSGFNYFFFSGMERFGFAPVLLSDATSGLRLNPEVEREYSSISQSTSFPLAAALAATWQPELAFGMGKAIGEECRAAGTGIVLGPGVNMHRTSTCGRNFEYLAEDPYLAGRLAVEYIKGVQSQKVIAAIKHFIANNNEFVRHNCNAVIDERTLHEIYLPAFAAAVQEGNVRAVMSSYNWLNGEKCGENKALLTDILRSELGYTGMVMSDWGGTEDMSKILGSGQNVVMPLLKNLGEQIRSRLAKDPAGTEKQLDAMIAPTLRVLFEMGIWDRIPADPAFKKTFDGHKTVARTIGESAITLLKNDQVLPLVRGQTILITGDLRAVTNSSSGGGSGYVRGYDHINFYAGLKAVFGSAVTLDANPSDEIVAKADRILYFFNMGDTETADRPFDLPENINRQIEALAAKNPNVIVVASSGTAFGTPWLDSVKGLVHGYFLGQEYGEAMANVLSGKVSPSGKLPFTMEKSFADSPAYGYNLIDGKPWWSEWREMPSPGVKIKIIDVPYSEGVFTGYRWYEAKKKPVNFPFGFGLSYTTFVISDLKVSAGTITKETPITVSVTVKNTGEVPGAEVVQLYVHDEEASVERPYRELKGFRKIFLQPGESKTVTMSLDWKALAFWDVKTHTWLAEPGAFTLLAGNSSWNVQCQTRIDCK
ncbi:MAG: glycoside hydrolase family 3 N-terminal domain-containing protein [Kiritimatiellales bacterium]|jgi:beta-glucosidase